MVRTDQGGSILNFIIVGVILALMVIGGAYFVRQRMQPTVAQNPAPVATSNGKSKETNTPNGQPAPAAAPPPASNEVTANKKTTPESNVAPSTPAAGNSSVLPHTGPVESFSTLLAVGMLSYASVAYIRSRRALILTSLL